MKSSTENEEPRRAMPYTDHADLKRAKLRANEEPKCMKSSTDNEEQKRKHPYIDNAAPKRMKLHRDNDDP